MNYVVAFCQHAAVESAFGVIVAVLEEPESHYFAPESLAVDEPESHAVAAAVEPVSSVVPVAGSLVCSA